MIKHSELRDFDYETRDTVKIINTRQAMKYIKHGVFPVDFEYVSKPIEGLYFIFDRDESQEVYDLWCRYELK